MLSKVHTGDWIAGDYQDKAGDEEGGKAHAFPPVEGFRWLTLSLSYERHPIKGGGGAIAIPKRTLASFSAR